MEEFEFGEIVGSPNFATANPNVIAGRVFRDANANGLKDPSESDGVSTRVLLVDMETADQPQSFVRTADTDANGSYRFDDVAPGQYQIRFVTPSQNATISQSNVGVDGAIDSDALGVWRDGTIYSDVFTFQSGQSRPNMDFGIVLPNAPAAPTGPGNTVSGRIFGDANGNGLRDPNEVGLPTDTRVFLVNMDALDQGIRDVQITQTNEFGAYFFEEVPVGRYQVRLEGLPEGKVLSDADVGTIDFIDSDGIGVWDNGTVYSGEIVVGGNVFADHVDFGAMDPNDAPAPNPVPTPVPLVSLPATPAPAPVMPPPAPAPAPPSAEPGDLPDSMKVLFVGNSFLAFGGQQEKKYVYRQFVDMAETLGVEVDVKVSIIGGANLRQHWFDTTGRNARDELANGDYDLVVLGGSASKSTFETYGKLFVDYARNFETDAIFYSLWGNDAQITYRNGQSTDTYAPYPHGFFREQAFEQGVGYAAAGMAMAEGHERLIEQGGLAEWQAENILTSDAIHPGNTGAYLMANVLFDAVFDVDAPTPDQYLPVGVTRAHAQLMQDAANAVTNLSVPMESDWFV